MATPASILFGLFGGVDLGEQKARTLKDSIQGSTDVEGKPRDNLLRRDHEKLRMIGIPSDDIRTTGQSMRNEYAGHRRKDTRPNYKAANYSHDRRARQNLDRQTEKTIGARVSTQFRGERRTTQSDLHDARRRQMLYAGTTKKINSERTQNQPPTALKNDEEEEGFTMSKNFQKVQNQRTNNTHYIPRTGDFKDNEKKQRTFNSDVATFMTSEYSNRTRKNFVRTGMLRVTPYALATQRGQFVDGMGLGTLDPEYQPGTTKLSMANAARRSKGGGTLQNPKQYLSKRLDRDVVAERALRPIGPKFNRNMSQVIKEKEKNTISQGKHVEFVRMIKGHRQIGKRLNHTVTEIVTRRNGGGADGVDEEGKAPMRIIRPTRGIRPLNIIQSQGSITEFPQRDGVAGENKTVAKNYVPGKKQKWILKTGNLLKNREPTMDRGKDLLQKAVIKEINLDQHNKRPSGFPKPITLREDEYKISSRSYKRDKPPSIMT